MTEKPVRIQRKRTKGWKMPPNTVSVTRPGKWGNPFYIINEEGSPWVTDGIGLPDREPTMLNHDVIEILGIESEGYLSWTNARRGIVELFRQRCVDNLPNFSELRGKNLACWCPLDQPCHADVLLELANKERP